MDLVLSIYKNPNTRNLVFELNDQFTPLEILTALHEALLMIMAVTVEVSEDGK